MALPLLVALLGAAWVRAEQPAADVTAGCSVTASQNQGSVPLLLDADRSTRYRASGAAELTITAQQTAFRRIYLIWDTPPGAYTLATGDGRTVDCGADGFLHELVELPEEQQEITLRLSGDALALCDVYLFTGGELPDWVQRWTPPYDEADMLVLPTHADDEHLWFGGTLPLYAGELGRKVQVAYLTNHWAEPYRPHELLDGLWTVGVTAYPVIGEFDDHYAGSLEQARQLYPEADVVAWQVRQLRRFRPGVVIGHDVDGEYGHGVHIYNTDTLRQALELSADPEYDPESAGHYGLWDVPKTYLHLWPENLVVMDWSRPLERFGGRTALEMAEEGFACHQSQVDYFAVEAGGPYDCRKFGLYRTTVGPDEEGGDFFENLLAEEMWGDQPDLEAESGVVAVSSQPEAAAPSEHDPAQTQGEPLSDSLRERGFHVWALMILLMAVLAALFVGAYHFKRGRSE